jgi:hypothetical protein
MFCRQLSDRRSINFFDPQKRPGRKPARSSGTANLAPFDELQPCVLLLSTLPNGRPFSDNAHSTSEGEEASATLIMIADPACVEANQDRALQSWVELGYVKTRR